MQAEEEEPSSTFTSFEMFILSFLCKIDKELMKELMKVKPDPSRVNDCSQLHQEHGDESVPMTLVQRVPLLPLRGHSAPEVIY